MKTNNFSLILIISLSPFIFINCDDDETYIPKSKGYFRIDFPGKKIQIIRQRLSLQI